MPLRGQVRPQVITLLNASLNTLLVADYDAFAEALRAIDKRPHVLATIWQGEHHQALGKLCPSCSCSVSNWEVVLGVSIRYTEPRASNLLITDPSAPHSGTSVKKTLDSPRQPHTVRDFFATAVAPVNTDVSRAVSSGTI